MPFASAWRIYRLLRYHSDMTCYDLSWPDSARYGVTCYDNTGNDIIFVFCKLTYTACFGIAIFDSIIACLVITGMWREMSWHYFTFVVLHGWRLPFLQFFCHMTFDRLDVYTVCFSIAMTFFTGLTYIPLASVLLFYIFLLVCFLYRLLRSQ